MSPQLAEDVVQHAWLQLWSELQNDVEIEDMGAWLYRVAHNAALNVRGRSGYMHEKLDGVECPAEPVETEVERRAVIEETLAQIAMLPAAQREALVRTAVAGDSRSQVANDLGVSEGAVGQLLHRARAKLRHAVNI